MVPDRISAAAAYFSGGVSFELSADTDPNTELSLTSETGILLRNDWAEVTILTRKI